LKKPSRILRVVAVLGMLVGLLAVTVGPAPAAAANESPLGTPNIRPGASSLFYSIGGTQEVYFPWVYNTDNFGLGDADGSVTVQNLSNSGGYVYFFVGNADGSGYTYTTYAPLNGGASKTFTADQIGVPAPGASVIAALYFNSLVTVGDTFTLCEADVLIDLDGDGAITDACYTYDTTADLWAPLPIAGVVKSAAAGSTLPYTTSADTSVSGYNGLSGAEVGEYSDEAGNVFGDVHYLPIVQTNCGPGGCWDTRLTVANFMYDSNQAITIRFFPADDGSGALQTGFQVEALLGPGATYQLDLSDWVPQGWVGSAHVFSDGAVGVIADRFKVGTNMWLTNIGSNQTSEFDYQAYNFTLPQPYVLFAPSVYLDFNGWNTGINVANLYEGDNNVNIQYYVNAGNAIETQSQRLAAFGMTYFYNPSSPSEDDSNQEVQYDRVSGALILSDEPVAAAVDAVKYFGNDQNVGQAMTYNATGNVYTWQAMPLVQKGNPADGMGATSGLNFINPNPANNAVTVNWLNQSGFGATNFGQSQVIIPPASLGFVYTMNQHNLPNGYYGSAIAVAQYPVAMASANVDYAVSGDGSTMWLGYNPCGLFRQGDFFSQGKDCPFLGNGLGNGQGDITVTKTVKTDAGAPVAGATVDLYTSNNDSAYYDYIATTNANGEAQFTNVTPGSYYIDVTLPSGYTYTEGTLGGAVEGEGYVTEEGPYTFSQENHDYSIDNTVYVASAQKIVQIVGPAGGTTGVDIEGMTVCIYMSNAVIPNDVSVDDTTNAVSCGVSDANGMATFNGLTAGVEYVPVVAGNGFDQVVGAPFTLAAGQSEVNYVALSAIPGALTKSIDLGDFDLGVGFGDFALNADVIFCKASGVPVDANGVIDTTACDNWVEDPAAVAHGGYDTNVGGSDFVYEFNAEVAPGNYVICSSAFVTGDFDQDPNTPNETVGYDFMCEAAGDNQFVDSAPATGPYTVYSGLETFVVNDFAALATGTVDVYVGDAAGLPLEGAAVTIRDAGGNIVASGTTDVNGAFSADLPAGTYTASASDAGFEDQDATKDYNVSDDAANGGIADDLTVGFPNTADFTLLLDPAAAP